LTDPRSRIIGIACVLTGVWIITYWVYQPSRAAPKVSLDELPQKPAPRPTTVTPPAPKSQPEVVQPPPILDPPTPPKPVRTRKVQKLVEPQFRDYLVQKGDTSFERIAARKEVFGDATKATILGRANPMFSPDRLKPGVTVLRVPLDPDNIQGKLVWVDEPIPDEPLGEPAPPKPAPQPEGKSYTIQSGDTLWTIAEKFYGKGVLWPTIAEANKDVLPDPDRPKVGAVLRIPPAPAPAQH
jgi:nucleoid-associated protein YgaU